MAFTVIMFTQSFEVALVTLFVLGMCCSARSQVGVLYIMEFCPKQRHAFVGGFFFMVASCFTLLAVFYFSFISKHWFGYIFIGYVM